MGFGCGNTIQVEGEHFHSQLVSSHLLISKFCFSLECSYLQFVINHYHCISWRSSVCFLAFEFVRLVLP
jgi:hypothetical protein